MIKLYYKEGCKHCEEAKTILSLYNIQYTAINLSEKDKRAEREYFRGLGVNFIPVLVLENGKIVTDCSADAIKELVRYGDLK
jgi:glutaredoxin